jgi:hypothetical protein
MLFLVGYWIAVPRGLHPLPPNNTPERRIVPQASFAQDGPLSTWLLVTSSGADTAPPAAAPPPQHATTAGGSTPRKPVPTPLVGWQTRQTAALRACSTPAPTSFPPGRP